MKYLLKFNNKYNLNLKFKLNSIIFNSSNAIIIIDLIFNITGNYKNLIFYKLKIYLKYNSIYILIIIYFNVLKKIKTNKKRRY